MLAYWIPEIGSTIPANASHRVGVGAFIMNEKKEVSTDLHILDINFCLLVSL